MMRHPWFNEKRSKLWMMRLIFWSLSLDASSFSWMLGQIVERIFVNCLSLICTRMHPTCRSSMVCLAMHLFDLSLRVSQVYVALGSNLTQDGPKDLHRLRRLTRLWGRRSSGSRKRSAIAPKTSLFGVKRLPQPTISDSPVPTGQSKSIMCGFQCQYKHLFLQNCWKRFIRLYRNLIKMDVEGSEYEVLEQMLEKQLLCKTRIDTLTIEWHLDKLMDEYKVKFDPKTIQKGHDIEQRLGKGDSCSEGEPTKVITLDDESFIEDGQPLPDEWVLNKCDQFGGVKKIYTHNMYIYIYICVYIYILTSDSSLFNLIGLFYIHSTNYWGLCWYVLLVPFTSPLSATKTANYVASGVMSSNQLDVGNWDGSGNLKFRRLMDLERIWNTGIVLSKVFNGKVWVPLGSSCSQNITPYCPLQPLCNPGIGHICWDISGVLSQIYPTLPRVMICYVLLLLTHCHPCSMTDLSDSRPESLWLGSGSTEASYTRWWHQHIR